MAGLIRFVLIVILIYLVFILIMRYIMPFVLRLFVRRMANKTRKQYEQQAKGNEKKKGEVTIDYAPKTNKKIDKDTGDYVPFEEIDD
jgi:hypothetical protein